MSDRFARILAALCETIVPGRPPDWPPGSDVIRLERLPSILDARDGAWAAEHCDAFPDLARADRAARLRSLEAASPDAVHRIVAAVYRAYYTAPEIRAVVEAVGEAGPSEPSRHFDDTLLAQVRATQAGRRRL